MQELKRAMSTLTWLLMPLLIITCNAGLNQRGHRRQNEKRQTAIPASLSMQLLGLRASH